MKTIRMIALTLLLSTQLLACSERERDWDEGAKAYDRGDYAEALAKWRPLAEQGAANAQHYVGFIYAEGLGVPQDNKEAITKEYVSILTLCKHVANMPLAKKGPHQVWCFL